MLSGVQCLSRFKPVTISDLRCAGENKLRWGPRELSSVQSVECTGRRVILARIVRIHSGYLTTPLAQLTHSSPGSPGLSGRQTPALLGETTLSDRAALLLVSLPEDLHHHHHHQHHHHYHLKSSNPSHPPPHHHYYLDAFIIRSDRLRC